MSELGPVPLEQLIQHETPFAKFKSILSQPEKATAPVLKESIFELAEDPDLRYSQAKEALGLLIGFIREYPDRVTNRDRFWPGEIPFFDNKKAADKEYVEAYQRLQRLERTQLYLDQFKEKVKQHPQSLDDDKQIYDFVIGADVPFKVDSKKVYLGDPTIYGPGDQILNGSIRMEIDRCKRFKEQTMPQLTNLQEDTFARSFGNIQLNSPHEEPKRVGRIYLNPDIKDTYGMSNVTNIFEYLAQDFNNNPELFHSIKMTDFAERGFYALAGYDRVIKDFLRRDKIVVYIDMDKMPQVLEYFREFYRNVYEPQFVFDRRIPKFTEPINFEEPLADRAYGISFAEEPISIEGEPERSRNQTLAAVLRRAAKKVGIDRLESAEFEEELRRQFVYFKIDPDNPAYNLRENPDQVKREPGNSQIYREYTSNFRKLRRKST